MLIVLYHLIPIIKINFLVLDEGATEGINDIVGLAKKEVKINFSKAKTKFCLSFHCCCAMLEIFKLKVHDNIRWYKFYLGSLSNDFTKNEQT